MQHAPLATTHGQIVTIETAKTKTTARNSRTTISGPAAPAVLFEAVVVPSGGDAVHRLLEDGRAVEFLRAQYWHCKPFLVFGDGARC